MIEKRQQAYLEAMNIPVWVARHLPEMDASAAAEVTLVEARSTPAGMESQQPDIEVSERPVMAKANDQAQPAEAVIVDKKQLDKKQLDKKQVDKKQADHKPVEKVIPQGLKLGPGAGGSLLVCARNSDSASKLSNDIARSLPKNPVWGWPDSDTSAVAPVEAVNENLFTCVAVFGDALAQLLFGNQVPAALGSAKLVILPAMSELESSAEARRQLWSELCRCGMVVS